ncbi:MAG: SDR family NAD(P)-dependent oxidoreductase [Burkholderia gladioli]
MAKDNSFTWQPADLAKLDLKGTKAIVVGGTGGVGRALSRLLALHGASVTVVGQTFRDQGTQGIEFIKADLALMSEAKRVAAQLSAETADLVIFTTGIMAGPEREQTSEGIERDMAISYLSRLVILREIAPRLGRNRPASAISPRVFIMGFPGSNGKANVEDLNAEKSYSKWKTHAGTVAGNEVLVLDAAKRYRNALFFGLNPGFVNTNIRGNLFGTNAFLLKLMEWLLKPFTITPEIYAARLAPLLISPSLESRSGLMFNNKAEAIRPSEQLAVPANTRILIEASEALVAKKTGITLPNGSVA